MCSAIDNFSESNENVTRLSGFHPYPAMVADELALNLADTYVKSGDRVLDPFCGSGRLLVAAARKPGINVGVDVNPLACLLTKSKAAKPNLNILKDVLIDLAKAKKIKNNIELLFKEQRRVKWYSKDVTNELSDIILWVNSLNLDEPEILILGASFSAAARNASYCRKDAWKLHRQDAGIRALSSQSAWDCLEERLIYYIAQATKTVPMVGELHVACINAKNIMDCNKVPARKGPFDLVLTSPPYGDSKTTVQYGAASGLCLDVVSQIKNLEYLFVSGKDIDETCLGGNRSSYHSFAHIGEIKKYWAGARDSKRAKPVSMFLSDYAQVCSNISSLLKPGGKAIFIVGQRSTGGFRLKLGEFTTDCLASNGLKKLSLVRRRLQGKRVPRIINRFGRAISDEQKAKGLTKTMNEELILTFEKPIKRS